MPNKLIELEGIIKWAKLFEHNKDTNEDFHGEGGAYTVNLVMEQDQLDKLSEAGSRLKPKITDDGVEVKFKRKHKHPIDDLGGTPKVVDADGNAWNPEVTIGNGSKGTLAVDVYDTKMGKGTRLRAVQVTDLEEFESDNKESGLPEWLK